VSPLQSSLLKGIGARLQSCRIGLIKASDLALEGCPSSSLSFTPAWRNRLMRNLAHCALSVNSVVFMFEMTDRQEINNSTSERPTVHELYEEIRSMYIEMAHEVVYFEQRMTDSNKQDLTPAESRMFIRSICSLFETIANLLKYVVLNTTTSEALNDAEMAILRERNYSLKENGIAEESKAKLGTLPNLRFAFGVFAKSKEVAFTLDTSGKEWQAMRRTFFVRDRLTHPHRLSDLTVSKDDLKDAGLALAWFNRQFLDVTTLAAGALRARPPKG